MPGTSRWGERRDEAPPGRSFPDHDDLRVSRLGLLRPPLEAGKTRALEALRHRLRSPRPGWSRDRLADVPVPKVASGSERVRDCGMGRGGPGGFRSARWG